MTDSADPRPILLLVDGSTYLHRAYHAHNSLRDHRNRPTGAIYGVVNALQKYQRLIRPDHIAVMMDAPGKNFRHDLYPEYKANRKPMDEELRMQIEPLHEIINALGLPLLVIPGVEADDVIGTLVRQGKAAGMTVAILSGDKDMAQLVDADVTLHDSTHDPWDAEGVKQKFSLRPDQIVDYLALAGDAADNIPGIPKVGAKTAANWLQKYETLDNLITHADEITGKVGEYLRANIDRLPLYRQLTTIKCDVELEMGVDALRPQETDHERLAELYERFNFQTFLKNLRTSNAQNSTADSSAAFGKGSQSAYTPILTESELKKWITRIRKTGTFAVRTETTSLDPQRATLVGLSLAVDAAEAAYIPIGHTKCDDVVEKNVPLFEANPAQNLGRDPRQLELEQVMQHLEPVLKDPELTKLGHHLKYDRTVLRRHGMELAGPFHDSMLESHVIKASANNRHSLEDLARLYLNEEPTSFETVTERGRGKTQLRFDQVAIEKATAYAAEDADMSLRLHQYFWPQLEAESAAREIYQNMELPLSLVLTDMERHGVAIDTALLQEHAEELTRELTGIKEEAIRECGHPFNLSSTKDLQQILFEERNLKPVKKTRGGSYSVDEEVLTELAGEDKLPQIILNYRERFKLLNTYMRKLPQMINPDTGRVHTSFHQAGTDTGRLSSSDPNLQNIPIRTPAGRRIRQAFSAPEGCVLIAADYSQIELRIMAHISHDPTLCRAFSEGADIHQSTAAEVFGTPHDAVSAEQRRAAKAINFGLMYGMGSFGLARQLHISREDADRYIETYFSRYPKVKDYMDSIKQQAKEQGYVETIYGRRLHVDAIQSRNFNQRRHAERFAINAPMQGTAADIIKRAMIDVHRWLKEEHPDCALVLQVHDELVLEVPQNHAEEITKGVCERMERATTLEVPVKVEARWADNWDQAH